MFVTEYFEHKYYGDKKFKNKKFHQHYPFNEKRLLNYAQTIIYFKQKFLNLQEYEYLSLISLYIYINNWLFIIEIFKNYKHMLYKLIIL